MIQSVELICSVAPDASVYVPAPVTAFVPVTCVPFTVSVFAPTAMLPEVCVSVPFTVLDPPSVMPELLLTVAF